MRNLQIILLTCVLAFAGTKAMGQENTFSYPGLLRASASFGTGFMLKHNLKNVYMHGDLEYYLNERISLRGESYYFFNSLNTTDSPLLMNHQVFSGANYHFLKDNSIDVYVGFQPGMAISQTMENPCPECLILVAPSDITVNPLISGLAGVNYYATKLFHIFLNARYLTGTHLSNQGPFNLDELRVSFGLGLNFNTKRKNS